MMATKTMTKTTAEKVTQKRVKDIEEAIVSLFDKFPNFRSCHNVNTPDVVKLKKQVEARKAELNADAKLAKLEGELKQARQSAAKQADVGREKVRDLLNRLRIRGVTEKLLEDVEAVTSMPSVKDCGYDCE